MYATSMHTLYSISGSSDKLIEFLYYHTGIFLALGMYTFYLSPVFIGQGFSLSITFDKHLVF